MIQFLRRVLEDIKKGENIDLIVAIPLAIIIAILGGLGIATTALVQSAILATLGLIVIGFLATRYQLEEINTKANAGDTVLFLTEKPSSLKGMMASSEEIWMAGLTLRTTTTEHFYVLKRRASQGLSIRTLIVDPDKLDMNKVVRRFSRAAEIEHFRADFKQTVKQYEEIRQSATNPDNVELRFLDFIPSYSLYIFPKTGKGGIVFAELYGFQSDRGSIPRFQITEHGHPEWYMFFVGQFNNMWNMWENTRPTAPHKNVVE